MVIGPGIVARPADCLPERDLSRASGRSQPREARSVKVLSSQGEGVVEAVILAAGNGSRLGAGLPKCLLELERRPLLHHQLEALEAAGVDRVTVVVGYLAPKVRDVLPAWVNVVENRRYALTNSLYSFMLARHRPADDLILLNGDVLCHPAVHRFLAATNRSTVAFDSTSGTDPEHMKLAISGGRLLRMSKTLPVADSAGENVGLLRLTRDAARAAFDAADLLVASGRRRDWVASAINMIASDHPLHCLDIASVPWVEIDFPADLECARSEVLPAIERTPEILAVLAA
jgi:L-glutamine-phosphate cytidylyltransferase